MSDNIVTFKGTGNGLTLILSDKTDFDSLLGEMEARMEAAGSFFRGASIMVRYRGRKLNPAEEEAILKLLREKSGAEIQGIEEDTQEETNYMAGDEEESQQPRLKIKKFGYFKGIEEGQTKFYRGTVRSGQLVSFNGNVVIIGDVNPGGVVEATGNIVVLGTLRGVVHAGADGNKEAFVAAFNLQPTQLRIADVITRAPDEGDVRKDMVPELAYIKDDLVIIERYLPQK